MPAENHTEVTEFVLLGIVEDPQIQVVLFVVFLIIYLINLAGNMGMIFLIVLCPHLQSPMYIFLSQLSFLDLCYSSAIGPKMLVDLLTERKVISFAGCFAQLVVFCIFGDTECFLLAAMAYDRYVAICRPLQYSIIMSRKVYIYLIIGSYTASVGDTVVQFISLFTLDYCSSNVINHFFCDVPPLFALSCSDIHINEMLLFACTSFIEFGSLTVVLMSYISIISTILKINSAEGRCKAFSTCASHLTVITFFYGTIIFMYLRPSSAYALDKDKWASIFYTLIIPMMNPLIYSVRNKEVKDAFKKIMKTKIVF
ncbi:olfactory receptor 1019-like [Sphaerodactylus townsendi]|uniref:olfactory receptor 1019-like n=1 Tax=Sphaerodactylus townsendi TaxID=933632 RepID=UPI0020263159|nr:olfactory receptor 1019-like [Sphaerodactylus townsendi]